MGRTLRELTDAIRENNIAKGWRPAEGGPGENTWGDYIALLHSEISEMLEAYRDFRLTDPTGYVEYGQPAAESQLPKPEGVGSEMADTVIRLLDMCDVFGFRVFDMDMALADVAPTHFGIIQHAQPNSFGDWVTRLHKSVAALGDVRPQREATHAAGVLRDLVATAERFGIDLDFEVERKIAFNATRSYQHGGRTVAGATQAPVTRDAAAVPWSVTAHETLVRAIPDDPRVWWVDSEVDAFVDTWDGLGLPELTMSDATGETLTLWTDAERAARMLDQPRPLGDDVAFTISKDEYQVCIAQAEETKETKDA